MVTHQEIKDFYDDVYHRGVRPTGRPTLHLRRLAARFVTPGAQVLDVACGTGGWLKAVVERGGVPHGMDISENAIEVCRKDLGNGDQFKTGKAEELPFGDDSFDLVTCLGSLEHFLDPHAALREMIRVSRPGAAFLILVPNAGFLTRKLGLFGGTQQVTVREDVRSLPGWKSLFEGAGLQVEERWKDLHVLSRDWIFRGRFYGWPLRFAQAVLLPVWPLSWQYQVYHLCRVAEPGQPA